MEFGLHLPNAGPFANGPDIIRVARTAEELGFHSVWLFDHLFTPTNLESKYPYSPDGSYAMLPEFPVLRPGVGHGRPGGSNGADQVRHAGAHRHLSPSRRAGQR